ncbi:MAG: hypothetical protein LC099_07585 [Anaerolineales bacterium]|nr:hypothetical protein [Anaerolineales bacterium]
MNKQELYKQADSAYQRGNRQLAKKYIADLLAVSPNDEAAWLLLARVADEKERKVQCYERVAKINPKNQETKLALSRARAALDPTLPLARHAQMRTPQIFSRQNILRGAIVALAVFLTFGASAFALNRVGGDTPIAKMLLAATPDLLSGSAALGSDVAPKTRAEVGELYPQYAAAVDALLSVALDSAKDGMENAPKRPGDSIVVSDILGKEARSILENGLPQPGTMTSITITEQQVTSWLALEMKNSPDLPLSDVQIYLRDGKAQIWGMINGKENSTSALAVGELSINAQKLPQIKIESLQIGGTSAPSFLLAPMESWLNQALIEAINEEAPGLQLVNLKVTNGLITASGTR